MVSKRRDTTLPPPFLRHIWLPPAANGEQDQRAGYPFTLPLIRNDGFDFHFERPVTILVGENGTGKSTILEAIAQNAGFSDAGGAQGMQAVEAAPRSGADGGSLGLQLRSAWLPQIRQGWFFRAETFFTVARYLDDSGSPVANYLSASHGEGFMAFFEERLSRQGLYILDEPEAALSPQRQFDFLKLLRRLQRANRSQIIMATHSPILMALPDADLWRIDEFGVQPVKLEETAHYQLYREFALYPHETVEAMID